MMIEKFLILWNKIVNLSVWTKIILFIMLLLMLSEMLRMTTSRVRLYCVTHYPMQTIAVARFWKNHHEKVLLAITGIPVLIILIMIGSR